MSSDRTAARPDAAAGQSDGAAGRPDGAAGHAAPDFLGLDDAIRTLLLLMPRMVGRAKRIGVPEELRSSALAPRHLSLLAYLLFDGPMAVNELAGRLEVAPATVSLMVGELDKKGILERTPDPVDRRRTIVSITEDRRPAIESWLGRGAAAWRTVLAPLSDAERALFTNTLAAYEEALCNPGGASD